MAYAQSVSHASNGQAGLGGFPQLFEAKIH
jgi:hypothetical protein